MRYGITGYRVGKWLYFATGINGIWDIYTAGQKINGVVKYSYIGVSLLVNR